MKIVTYDVVGSDPAYPWEVTQGGKDISREEVPAAWADEGIQEESFTADASTITHAGVMLMVKGGKKSAVDKIIGPNHRTGMISSKFQFYEPEKY